MVGPDLPLARDTMLIYDTNNIAEDMFKISNLIPHRRVAWFGRAASVGILSVPVARRWSTPRPVSTD
jgi:hypothetical protein